MIKVYQIRLKLFLLKNIQAGDVQALIARFIDKSFLQEEKFMVMHEENIYKNYCYDLLAPLEKDKVYKAEQIYTLTIRTVDEELADFFYRVCPEISTREFKGLNAQIRILPKKIIEFIYTLTPVIIKSEDGYWRNTMTPADFAERLNINLLKKYKQLTKADEVDTAQIYSMLEFLNKRPIPMKYKKIKLLGDKVRLSILDDEFAQELAYLSLGVGIGEMNARGAGFVNYRWL